MNSCFTLLMMFAVSGLVEGHVAAQDPANRQVGSEKYFVPPDRDRFKKVVTEPDKLEGPAVGELPVFLNGTLHIQFAGKSKDSYVLLDEQTLEALVLNPEIDIPDGIEVEFHVFRPFETTRIERTLNHYIGTSIQWNTLTSKQYEIRCAISIRATANAKVGVNTITLTLPGLSDFAERELGVSYSATMLFRVHVWENTEKKDQARQQAESSTEAENKAKEDQASRENWWRQFTWYAAVVGIIGSAYLIGRYYDK